MDAVMTSKDTSKIKLDSTQISVVVTCTACSWWFGFALDKIEGWQVGDRHQRRHHPNNHSARNALAQARKRAQLPTT